MSGFIVDTADGKVKGKVCDDYLGGKFFGFYGIPYAKPPIGDLRFKPPQEQEPWQGIKDATKEGPACPSRHLVGQYFMGKEDNCLNLNVFTKHIPKNDEESLKPVMVFIHGGGFVYGNNKGEIYGPQFLLIEDIVLVVVNYRIGVFGFLALEDQSLGISGNAGLKDQVMALKWVQRNIRHFGGDPNNVTLFGQSAGSASTHLHMLSPLSKGLFHKAICQSGVALNLWAKGFPNAKVIARDLGYKETDEKSIFEKLKMESVRKIVNAQYKIDEDLNPDQQRPYCPIIEHPSDEAFLSEDPVEIIKSGRYNKVPFMIGYTSKEGILYALFGKIIPNKLPKNLEHEVPFDLNINGDADKEKIVKKKIRKFYFNNKELTGDTIDEFFHLKGDLGFKYHIQKALELHRSTNENPMYFYIFSHDGPMNLAKDMALKEHRYTTLGTLLLASISQGVNWVNKLAHAWMKKIPEKKIDGPCHCDELSYMFRQSIHPKIEPGSQNDFYVRRMVKLWTNFAMQGHPTPHRQDELLNNIVWEAITKDNLNYLKIDAKLSMDMDPDKAIIDFWDDIYSNKN
ncbi:unnamed protein product [Brassicogethes aeneus]|uniref:Carboxylic ester hydrolase n=1 Tax=Brassicogethes aeneus TaxID=1431903 RepID=A0A9P0FDZ5_BRAAE|nr:unnamed protein product [Brassicogethes aeneus]